MTKEPNLIMQRRFTSRILESGLLIIAVALGVGTAASGLSLLFHTNEYSNSLLASPEYREVVVTTKTNMEDMEFPVVEKTDDKGVTLTSYDLGAGDLIPGISYSYITNYTRMGFITDRMLNQVNTMEPGQEGPDTGNGDRPDENSTDSENDRPPENNFEENFNTLIENYKSAKDDPNFIIPEVDSITGREITEQFFSAWNLETIAGSLFTTKDYTSNNHYIILGSGTAELLAGDKYKPEELVNKKIVSWNSSYTIIGILEVTNTDFDDFYFTPVRELDGNNRFRRGPGGNNQQLRFAVLDPEELDSTAVMLQKWFDTNYSTGQVIVSNPRAEATRLVSRNQGISILILFLSLAGLFIASVNVSNILMSRSIRMKKHVGILKALGASKKSIVKLFIGEALIITTIGSLLGAGLAVPLSIAMEKSLGLGEVSWLYILIGVVLSSLLTLLFSVIPARQNSGIEAAVAMRSAG